MAKKFPQYLDTIASGTCFGHIYVNWYDGYYGNIWISEEVEYNVRFDYGHEL